MALIQKDFCQNKQWLSTEHRAQLLLLISASFANVDASQYFEKYFTCNSAFGRKLRLYFDGTDIVGYCLLTLHRDDDAILVKASAAFYPEHRQGGNTFDFSLLVVSQLKLKHPLTPIFYADTMLSPAMYRAMAKNVAIIYPSSTMPKTCEQLFLRFNPSGTFSEFAQRTCVVHAGRTTNYTPQEVASFRENTKKEIAYYCHANPDFDKGYALFVIMPITLKQFLLTGLKLLKNRFH